MTQYLDCSVKGADNELFIVEGKSSLAALDQVRSRASQAVFAVQGKIPNVTSRSLQRIHQHQPTRTLLETLGFPLSLDNSASQNLTKCRFSQILLATDPDPDGHHSRWLLLLMLQRFCAPLLESGRVSIVSAPVYRVGSEDSENCQYFWSEHDKQQFLATTCSNEIQDITAFKGLASLSANELHRWVVAKQTRRHASTASG